MWYAESWTAVRGIISQWDPVKWANRTIPPAEQAIIQPYLPPFIPKAPFNRKAELRVFLAITSITPLRVYFYSDPFVVLATRPFNSSTTDNCAHDTHTITTCTAGGNSTVTYTLAEYATGAGIRPGELVKQAKLTLQRVLRHPNVSQTLRLDHNNKKLIQSRATVFSYLRADFGIVGDAQLALFEVNQWPYQHLTDHAQAFTLWYSLLELFRMIGLDLEPYSDAWTMRGDQDLTRRSWELGQLDRWVPLAC